MTPTAVQCGRPASYELLTHDHPATDRAMTQDYQKTDWHCLAGLQPTPGQRCEWKFVADSYTEQGIGGYYTGIGGTGFNDDNGCFVSDPERTYWRAIPAPLIDLDFAAIEPTTLVDILESLA